MKSAGEVGRAAEWRKGRDIGTPGGAPTLALTVGLTRWVGLVVIVGSLVWQGALGCQVAEADGTVAAAAQDATPNGDLAGKPELDIDGHHVVDVVEDQGEGVRTQKRRSGTIGDGVGVMDGVELAGMKGPVRIIGKGGFG